MESQLNAFGRSLSATGRYSLIEGMTISEGTPLSWVELPSGRYHFCTVNFVAPIFGELLLQRDSVRGLMISLRSWTVPFP